MRGSNFIDRTGLRYGRWLVLSRGADAPQKGGKAKVRWLCRCDCGEEVKVMSGHLNEANTTSCGCALRDILVQRNSTHGGTGSAEHNVWRGMLERCTNPNAAGFEHYGGRGIKVCARWQEFENFLADVGRRPSPDHSIDRKEVDGNYEPGNCRWATMTEQARNRRNNIIVRLGEASVPLSQAVEMLGGTKLNYKAIHKRMTYRGQTFEHASAAVGIARG